MLETKIFLITYFFNPNVHQNTHLYYPLFQLNLNPISDFFGFGLSFTWFSVSYSLNSSSLAITEIQQGRKMSFPLKLICKSFPFLMYTLFTYVTFLNFLLHVLGCVSFTYGFGLKDLFHSSYGWKTMPWPPTSLPSSLLSDLLLYFFFSYWPQGLIFNIVNTDEEHFLILFSDHVFQVYFNENASLFSQYSSPPYENYTKRI